MELMSRHVSVFIARPVAVVYAFASNPSNLPLWAAGLSGSIAEVDGRWVADSPMGTVSVAFAPENDFGVLDHEVTTATGEVFANPMRVVASGAGSEVVFTVRRLPGTTDDAFSADADTVLADLQTLRRILEEDPDEAGRR